MIYNLENSLCVILKCIAGPHIGQRFRLEPSGVSYIFVLIIYANLYIYMMQYGAYINYRIKEVIHLRWVGLQEKFLEKKV